MTFLENNMQGFEVSGSSNFLSANVPPLTYAVASNLGFGNRVVRQKQKTRGLEIMPPIYSTTYFHGELMIMSLLASRPVTRDLVGTKLQQPFRLLQRMGAKRRDPEWKSCQLALPNLHFAFCLGSSKNFATCASKFAANCERHHVAIHAEVSISSWNISRVITCVKQR